MAMTIMHDASAAMTLGELNKNANRLTKDLRKVSSGLRITGAADDASGYAISEKMRAKVRGLNQDIENAQNGYALLRVAEGGVQSIIDELRTLKELALNSANDHNSDVDRATLQKEFDQRKANIDNIAEETNYNGRLLLNGDWCRTIWEGGSSASPRIVSSTTTSNTTTSPVSTSTVGPQTSTRILPTTTKTTSKKETTTSATPPASTETTTTGPVTTTNTSTSTNVTGPTSISNTTTSTNSTVTTNGNLTTVTDTDTTTTTTTTTTKTDTTETTTTQNVTTTTIISCREISTTEPVTPTIIHTGDSISASGVYQFADDFTGTLPISASNVTLLGPDGGGTLNDVYIEDSGSDLYIKNLSISNTQNKATIAFNSSPGKLHILGDNHILITNTSSYSSIDKAVIRQKGDMSIVGTGKLDISRTSSSGNSGYIGAVIGTDINSGTWGTSPTIGDISIGDGVTLNISEYNCYSSGAAIGASRDAKCGNIYIGSNTNITITRDSGRNKSFDAAAIGAGSGVGVSPPNSFTRFSSCGDIIIYSGAKINAETHADYSPAPSLGTGTYLSKCGNITIYPGADCNLGTYWTSATTGLSSNLPSTNCVVIGSGPEYCSCGDITVYSGSTVVTQNNTSSESDDYGASYSLSTCGTVNTSATGNAVYSNDADNTDPSLGTASTTSYEITTETITTTATTVSITETTETRYDTVTTITEEVTTTTYEAPEYERVARLNDPLIIHTGTKANEHLRVYIEDMGLETLGIANTKINPREAAEAALETIDSAIDYVLNQATHIGAYESRLGFTEENLTTASENTQASESTIRDADMAMEMMRYTKDSILAQTAQAMLAQANQNASSVLSLLQ